LGKLVTLSTGSKPNHLDSSFWSTVCQGGFTLHRHT